MTTRNYGKEYREYHGTPEQKRKRARRNRDRRRYEAKHGDLPKDKHVDHIDPLRHGLEHARRVRAVPAKKNLGWRRGKKGYG